MAVMGVQLLVTLLAATLLHRLAPRCSFARWLLCNGSLYRYKHPTDEQLCALAGKQRPKGRRDRRAGGVAEDKPLSVPRDIELQLDTSPITAVDALVLRYFLEYQWFVDFSVYAGAVYVFSEGYSCLASPAREGNLGVLWCLLTVLFCVKVFLTVMRHYFRSEEGGERSVCLTAAFLFLLLAMLALLVREDFLEFGLEAGLAGVSSNLEPILKPRGWEWTLPLARLAFKLGLVALGSLLGACLTFPGLRLAQTHLDALSMAAGKPLTRLSDASFDTLRLWAVVALSLLRLLGTRHHLQAYLGLAERWVRRMRRQAGRIPARDIQQQISRIYCYVSVVSLQYLGPVILTLHCTLLLKTLGHLSWGLYPASPAVSPAAPVAPPRPEGDGDRDVQVVVQEISGVLGCIFTPPFFRGLFSFLTWWVAACQVVTSLFGLYFHQYLAAS
ncbi:transmembrane protein 161A isoform X2 [Passer montanus]|uniref:transmembrane protein 161A isoform X2 n=1 Tax=Passer montanus TaxID=9160 RepID=UPI00196221E2|nr:transmembrane protein 161A isoform X2 [Passer montanus]